MNVTTTYENMGPVVKELKDLKFDEFFQFPTEGCVYRLLTEVKDGYLCLSLDDLQAFVQPGATLVEPCEVNSIEVKVEML